MDEVRNERLGYRYLCHRDRCRYATRPLTMDAAFLVARVHRHRHAVGKAGIYHREKK